MKNEKYEEVYEKLISQEPIVSDIVLKKFRESLTQQCSTVYIENVFELS